MRRNSSVSAMAWLVAAAISASSWAPAVALARPGALVLAAPKKPLRDTLTGEAKAAFLRGVTLFNAKNPSGALAEFDSAYQLSHEPRLLFNMALAQRDLLHYAAALTLLRRELAEGEGNLADDDRKTAQQVIDGLKQYVAALTVTSGEADAEIFVDEIDTGKKTPLTEALTVDVGERAITLRKPGYLDGTRKVTIAGSAPASVEVPLEVIERRGKLVVRALGAPAATVYVDGKEGGPAPWEGEIKAGEKHNVEIRARGFVTESRSQEVDFRGTSVLEVTLRPEQGKVRIETDKPETDISIDGQHVASGLWEGVLPSGGHQVVASREGMQTSTTEVVVQTDQSRTLKLSLQPKATHIPWYAWVIGGAVLVGGGVAIYFGSQKKPEPPKPGSIDPGTVPVGLRF